MKAQNSEILKSHILPVTLMPYVYTQLSRVSAESLSMIMYVVSNLCSAGLSHYGPANLPVKAWQLSLILTSGRA